MQQAIFLAAPTDVYRAKVVSAKWVGESRVVAAPSALSDPGAGSMRTVAVVIETRATAADPSVRAALKLAVAAGVPIIGIDASTIADEMGRLEHPGEPLPETDRHYKWSLDNGSLEITEWIDYELSHSNG